MAVAGKREDAVRAVVMDYVEGWFDGDKGRMERALHPEAVKRCRGIEGDDPDALETLSARQMIDATADLGGRVRMLPTGGSRSGSTISVNESRACRASATVTSICCA